MPRCLFTCLPLCNHACTYKELNAVFGESDSQPVRTIRHVMPCYGVHMPRLAFACVGVAISRVLLVRHRNSWEATGPNSKRHL